MTTLRILPLTDSFSSLWPDLASDLGLELAIADSPLGLERHADSLLVISAGGREDQLEPAILQIVAAGLQIAAVGSMSDHRLAAAVIRSGATEYFSLPDDLEALRGWLAERAAHLKAGPRRTAFVEAESAAVQFEGLIGSSPALRAALERTQRVIPHAKVTVLISGETGTGKELLARAIHYNGPRREAPFVDINCAAIPEQLLESELFGHDKGAFTSATSAKPGLFELADGGTLFLDEIGHLPLAVQGKLLRALEERMARRVGGIRTIKFDVRVIAATHVRLEEAVERGEFREDLFYRLNVVPIELPPLRARKDDILNLARHFLERFAAEYGFDTPALTAGAERALLDRMWPGNVRELRNVIERAVVLAGNRPLDVADVSEVERPATSVGKLPFPATLVEIERAAAQAMVDACAGNKSDAARRLAISRARLQRLLDAAGDPSTDVEPIHDDE